MKSLLVSIFFGREVGYYYSTTTMESNLHCQLCWGSDDLNGKDDHPRITLIHVPSSCKSLLVIFSILSWWRMIYNGVFAECLNHHPGIFYMRCITTSIERAV